MLVGTRGRWNPNSINFISERQRGQVHIKLERSRSSAGPLTQPGSSRFRQRARQSSFGRLAGRGGRPERVPVWHCGQRGGKAIQMFSTEIAGSRSLNLKFLPVSNSFHERGPVNRLALSSASGPCGPDAASHHTLLFPELSQSHSHRAGRSSVCPSLPISLTWAARKHARSTCQLCGCWPPWLEENQHPLEVPVAKALATGSKPGAGQPRSQRQPAVSPGPSASPLRCSGLLAGTLPPHFMGDPGLCQDSNQCSAAFVKWNGRLSQQRLTWLQVCHTHAGWRLHF